VLLLFHNTPHLVEHVQHAAQLAAAGADGHLNHRELPDEPLHELTSAKFGSSA
jgi:hypothetical protein